VRRAQLAAAILGAALILPGLSFASRYTCGTTDPCPAPNVSMTAGASQTVADLGSSLSYTYNATSGSAAVPHITYMMPKGWRFAAGSLRAGAKADGVTPATSCDDIYTPGSQRSLQNAEGIGLTTLTMKITSPDDTTDPVSGTYSFRDNASFISWDGTTAKMCLNFYSGGSTGLDGISSDPFGFIPSDAAGLSDLLFPATLKKLDATSAYGWQMDIDATSFYKNPAAAEYDAEITIMRLTINDQSGGNWNRDQNGRLARVLFSRSPLTAGARPVAGTFTGCSQGVDASTASACKNGATTLVTKTSSIVINDPAETHGLHQFGRISGFGVPSGSGTAALLTPGYTLVRGSSKVNVQWQAPAVTPDDTIRGYVIAIAVPGDKASEVFVYKITQPFEVDANNNPVLDGTGNPIPVAGSDASACDGTGKCSAQLSFPMTGIGGHVLDGNNKYDVALVTIYADGHRSDGKIDPHDATTGAAICPGGAEAVRCGDGDTNTGAAFRVDPTGDSYAGDRTPGTSIASLFVASKSWGGAFVETDSFNFTGKGGTYTAPKFLLLTNLATKEGQFVDYRPAVGAPAKVYYGASNTSVSPDGVNGELSFGNLNLTGGRQTFQFSGCVSPDLGCPSWDAGSNTDGPDFHEAAGVFMLFDPKNVGVNPGAITVPPNPSRIINGAGMPGADAFAFAGYAV
jgi:hypothetical protein